MRQVKANFLLEERVRRSINRSYPKKGAYSFAYKTVRANLFLFDRPRNYIFRRIYISAFSLPPLVTRSLLSLFTVPTLFYRLSRLVLSLFSYSLDVPLFFNLPSFLFICLGPDYTLQTALVPPKHGHLISVHPLGVVLPQCGLRVHAMGLARKPRR